MKFEVRNIKKTDFSYVARLHFNEFKVIGGNVSDFEKSLKLCPYSFVAIKNSKIIGYLTARVEGRELFLQWGVVEKKTRNQGIGKALFLKAIEKAKKHKLKSIGLATRNRFKDALHLYIDLGFEVHGTTVQVDGETMIWMRKEF